MAGKLSKINIARAIRYLADALEDEVMAKKGIDEAISSTLFHCQQMCEKGMKACLALIGIFVAEEHEVTDIFANHILPKLEESKKVLFESLLSEIEKIEWLYIPSRYGVDRYGRVWVKEHNTEDAKRILKISQRWLELSFQFVQDKIETALPKDKKGLIDFLKAYYSDVIKE